MTEQPNEGITFSQAYEFRDLGPLDSIPVPVEDWRALISKFDKAAGATQVFVSIGWTAVGVGATSLFTAISLGSLASGVPDHLVSKCWEFTVVALLTAAISFIYAGFHYRDRCTIKTIVTDDMKTVLKRYDK